MVPLNPFVYDCIVVGSGPGGTMCAQTLLEAGRSVLMLDGGIEGDHAPELTARTLYEHKTTGTGNELMKELQSSLQWKQTGAAEQLTPPRRYVVSQTEKLLPVESTGFQLMESLAYGGLGAAWGLGCYQYTSEELALCGLPVNEMAAAYEVVAQRIGIAYTPDDLAPFVMNSVRTLQPAIEVDENAQSIYLKYGKQKSSLNAKGFYAGRPPLALLTAAKEERAATDYSNMDFYLNRGKSAWRPSITLDKLRNRDSFQYQGNCIVTAFHERDGLVNVTVINIRDHSMLQFCSKHLVIACGAASTARIVARSLSAFNHSLPLLSNPYGYITALLTERLGKIASHARTSTVQLAVIGKGETPGEDGMGSLYSYDALPMSNVLKQVPMGFADGRVFMQYLLPAIVIAGVHHPDRISDQKYIQLIKKGSSLTGDALQVQYELSAAEEMRVNTRTKAFRHFLKSVGCMPVKTVQPPHGSSIHYAGTLPYDQSGKQLTTYPDGRLAQTNHVFIADASPFLFLPAKGLTFTIMANAHRTALQLLKNE